MKCDQDLCLNFWYDLRMLLWQDELTLLAATATGTFTIFLLVTYTLARYVTLGGQNILGISELTYTILILFCEFNFNFAHRV